MSTPMTQFFDLRDRVALVTGGNGGLGLGMALGLAGAGASVVILGRTAIFRSMLWSPVGWTRN